MNCYFRRLIQTCSLLTAHLLFFPSNLIYILAPTGNIKEGLLQHDGYSSHRNYIITSRNKYDVSSVTNWELNSELSVGGLNSCLNMERGEVRSTFGKLSSRSFCSHGGAWALCKISWSCIQGVLLVPGGSRHRPEQIGLPPSVPKQRSVRREYY